MELDNYEITAVAAESLSEGSDLTSLGGRKSTEWIIAWLGEGLDLHGDEIVAGPGDHIEFTPIDPNVSVDNSQTLPDEELAGEFFAKVAKLTLL